MKHLFPLTVAVLLLSGCPEAKLPTPAPKVPEPKAEITALSFLPFSTLSPAFNREGDRVPAFKRA